MLVGIAGLVVAFVPSVADNLATSSHNRCGSHGRGTTGHQCSADEIRDEAHDLAWIFALLGGFMVFTFRKRASVRTIDLGFGNSAVLGPQGLQPSPDNPGGIDVSGLGPPGAGGADIKAMQLGHLDTMLANGTITAEQHATARAHIERQHQGA
jgi:hypothetical protein